MKRYTQLILNILVPILMIAAVVIFVPKLIIFFIPFIIGAVIAWIANPLIRFLNTKTKLMERQHASVVIIIFMLVLIGAILYLVLSVAVRFCVGFAKDLPDMVRDLAQLLREFLLSHQSLLQHLSLNLPGTGADGAAVILDLNKLNSSIEESLLGFVTNISAPIANVSIGAVRSIPNVLVYSVVTIFSAYCFCKDGEHYVERVKAWIPKELFHYYELLKADIRRIIQGWLLAQFKIMFVVFLVLAIGFLLLRVRYALPLAALTAFLDFLPMLGVGFILWPWIVLDLFSGNLVQALWLVVIYVATQIVRQFMQPKIMGDTMGLSPFLTILFMYLGYRFYGFVGLIFAVPVGMLVMCFYRYGAFKKMTASIQALYRDLISFL